jgi:saccharopine dehydrogenase-like NADP-dependent oxidoreductase
MLAGQGTAQYIENGCYKYIPYNRLFTQTETISIQGHGSFDAYANRDSLSYRKFYDIEKIPTMLRGTLRMPGYCKAWNVFVKLGLTDDSYKIEASESLTWKQLMEAFLPNGNGSIREKLKAFMGAEADEAAFEKIDWLDIYGDRPLGIAAASPAQILQQLLEEKWKLGPDDKDMIVMQHIFEFQTAGKKKKITSSLVVKGHDQIYTAMAKTVGLPLAITAKLILQDKISSRGVLIPTIKEIYEPVLNELEEHGIVFEERETNI